MGDPTDTITMAHQRFDARYAPFADELPKTHRAAYEDMRRVARRGSTALNRMGDMDFERPMFLLLLINERVRNDALEAELNRTRMRLDSKIGDLEAKLAQLLAERGDRPERSQHHGLALDSGRDPAPQVPVPA